MVEFHLSFLEGNHIWKILCFLFDIPVYWFFPNISFLYSLKRISEISRRYKRKHWENVGYKTVVHIRLFPLWIYKVEILKKETRILKWNAGSRAYNIYNIATK